MVHNDLNAFNVLVDDTPQITGHPGFGDMVHTALVNDVAVAASYHVHDAAQPLRSIALFVAAYHRVTPLEVDEVNLLYDLVAARFVASFPRRAWVGGR